MTTPGKGIPIEFLWIMFEPYDETEHWTIMRLN